MSIIRCCDNTFTFKNYQRLEVNKTINGKFYQFCHSMEVGENYMIYNTHNPNAGKDWAKRYKCLEIYSNNINPFQSSPPGIGSGWDIKEKDNNYYWDLGTSKCICPYSSENGCSEHNTDWKETQGDKLIYYEGATGSITFNPLRLWYDGTGFFKPISTKWKKQTGTFKLKIEPTHNLSDDCDEINQIEFKLYSDKFQKTITDIIEKGNYMYLLFDRDKRGGHGYIKRGKTGNKVAWITPYDLYGFEDYNQWLRIKDSSNVPIKDKNQSENYENWTKEQLITEIKILKAEIEGLKNDKFLSDCSKRFKLEEKQAKLEKMEKFVDSKTLDNSTNETDSNNTNYLPYVLGGMSILTVGIVIGFLVRKRVKKSK